jgi:hypothetical protein
LSLTQGRQPSQDPIHHFCSLVFVLSGPAQHPILLVLSCPACLVRSCSSCPVLLCPARPARPALSCYGLSCPVHRPVPDSRVSLVVSVRGLVSVRGGALLYILHSPNWFPVARLDRKGELKELRVHVLSSSLVLSVDCRRGAKTRALKRHRRFQLTFETAPCSRFDEKSRARRI